MWLRCAQYFVIAYCGMFVFMSVVVIVWWFVGIFVVYRPLLKKVGFEPGVLKYVVCVCKGCDGCCVFCLY